MFYKLRKSLKKRRFARQARHILGVPPITHKDAPILIMSNLCHDDVIMYLVAMKSFYPRIGGGDILIVNDGSLTDSDKALLKQHLCNPEIRDAATVDTGACPDYIAWRGLRCAIDASKDRYVIKLDSDVVALDDLPEIKACVAENRSFVLGSFDCEEIWTPEQALEHARGFTSDHIQIQAERSFVKFPDADNFRYVRGCSGFAGYQKGLYEWADVEAFCQKIEQHIDRDEWRKWGSEQVTVNSLVANSPNPLILKMPKYTNHREDTDVTKAALVHFLGTWRFYGGRYAACARRAVATLSA
ncbi:hypothetical protein JCM17845_08410 [Iodidimonas gelatinilytica]|uniref:Glycosyltransferase 2-like domain-containing protein n=1 Tax=Iodidimonas gelatinilytica TaxID=1236966 RepID=A0A5A7MWI6_9PROT|nr:glycosyltransferase family A protein [Iodidimonas gelatinilytica]GER00218.1 hypothetical protein JCM17845_08410 [Iodidimonas gelatinilytica]